MDIKFFVDEKYNELIAEPYPAYKKIPSWFSNTEIISKKSKCPFKFLYENGFNKVLKNVNVTNCPGIMDYFSMGYIIPSWNNFLFRNCNDKLYINWEHDFGEKYSFHDNSQQVPGFELGEKPKYGGFSKISSPWHVRTSSGVSCLIIHPMWHRENRFTTVSGVMHTDIKPMPIHWFFEWNTNIKNDMTSNIIENEQIVSRETPLMIIIPFLRKNFNLNVEYLNENYLDNLQHKSEIFIRDWLNNSLYNKFRKKIGRLFR